MFVQGMQRAWRQVGWQSHDDSTTYLSLANEEPALCEDDEECPMMRPSIGEASWSRRALE